jgi:hypothetical protein
MTPLLRAAYAPLSCLVFCLLLFQTMLGARAGEAIYCDCQFQQSSGYVGVGTAQGCSALTHKNTSGPGERCVFSVGATGYNFPAVSNLKTIPSNYRYLAFQVTILKLQAVLDHNVKIISTENYLRDAIPAYMRASYLRDDAQLNVDTVERLDTLVVQATNQYAEQIAHVFQGQSDRFDATIGDSLLVHAVPGAVTMDYRDNLVQLHLVASFFNPSEAK